MIFDNVKLLGRQRLGETDSKMKTQLSAALRQGAVPQQNKNKSHFDRAMTGIVTTAIDGFAVPWIIKCLRKYTEAQFHYRLNGHFCSIHDAAHLEFTNECMPFSFILDWHLNHKTSYGWFLTQLKLLKRWYEFDVDAVYRNLIEYLSVTWGWQILEHERRQIYKEICQVRNMVYYDNYDGPQQQ
jgi:hypothetical protein